MCMDTSVASLVLDGRLLSGDEVTLDELLCVVTKWKDPVEKFGGPRNFPPTYRAITTYEWVRSNFGSFVVTFTTSVLAELRHSPQVINHLVQFTSENFIICIDYCYSTVSENKV